MTRLSVVHDEWSAGISARLADSGLVEAVAVIDADAGKIWQKSAAAARLRALTEAAPEGELAAVETVLLWGRPALAPWLTGSMPAASWITVAATGEDGLTASDPVYWALRHDRREVRIRLIRSGPDLRNPSAVGETTVDLTGADYQQGLDAVANGVARVFRDAPAAPPAESAPSGRPAVLPLDGLSYRVDWTTTAESVTRQIQAASGRPTAAWTYLNGFPVSLGSAEIVEPASTGPAAGTILRCRPDGAVVQAGAGTVRIGNVRDAVGPLRNTTLRPGLRFGIDAQEEIRSLWRRIADLERTVQWLLAEREVRDGSPL